MRFLTILGKFLISVGVGVLLFVAWTLWGTGLYTQQQQDELAQEFDRLPLFDVPLALGEEEFEVPERFKPDPGQPVFRLMIPEIDLRQVVVEGVAEEQLRLGPGHYPECRAGFDRPLCTDFEEIWPGEKGRVVVSGHRTTYGQPFWALNELKRGDEIITDTKWGRFTYEVTETQIVEPDSLGIVIPSEEAEIVLTTCNPRYSAAQRLIVFAELQEDLVGDDAVN